MNKTILILGIIFLLVGISLNPTIAVFNSNDDTTPPVTTHTLDPPIPDGDNGWYVSDVTVTLNATDDISGVMKIQYRLDDELVWTIPGDYGTFIIDIDKENISIEYWAVDNACNEETHHNFVINMDKTDPVVNLKYKCEKDSNGFWFLVFNATAIDETSQMNHVGFYLNDAEQYEDVGPGPFYSWSCYFIGALKIIIEARACDNAGNVDCDIIRNPECPKNKQSKHNLYFQTLSNEIPIPIVSDSGEDCDCQSNGKTHLAEKLLTRLEKDEVLSKLIKSDNPKDDTLICEFLYTRMEHIEDILYYYAEQLHKYENNSLMYMIYFSIWSMHLSRMIPIVLTALYLDCDWVNPYPPY